MKRLVFAICLFFIGIAIILLGIHALLVGDYFDCLWLVIFIIPWIFPKLKESISIRWEQAKNYLKSIFKRVK